MYWTLQPVPYISRGISDVIEVSKTANIDLALSTFAASVLPLATQTRALVEHSDGAVTVEKVTVDGKLVASINLMEDVEVHVHAAALKDIRPQMMKKRGYLKNFLNIFDPFEIFKTSQRMRNYQSVSTFDRLN